MAGTHLPPTIAFEIDPVEGQKVGRDPRKMTLDELAACGHQTAPILKIVRGMCLECAGGQPSEDRLCTTIGGSLWPIRMSFNPFRTRGPEPAGENSANGEGLSDAEDAADRDLLS